jgi:hypothetical protein
MEEVGGRCASAGGGCAAVSHFITPNLINECPASLAESAIALLQGRICRRSGPSDQRSVVSISKADQSAGATSCAYSNLLTIDKAMWAIPSKTWSNPAPRVLRIAVPQPRNFNLRNERLVRPGCARAR